MKYRHWKREIVAWERRRCNTADVNVVVETVTSQSEMIFFKNECVAKRIIQPHEGM